jgi:phosphoglycolate phosphatase-like HAD superfamily hydrolase
VRLAPDRTCSGGDNALGRDGKNLAIIPAVIEAVIVDLDGVLLDSEQLWDRTRREVAQDHGGHWVAEATAAMQGMSSVEWARYLIDALGVQLSLPRARSAGTSVRRWRSTERIGCRRRAVQRLRAVVKYYRVAHDWEPAHEPSNCSLAPKPEDYRSRSSGHILGGATRARNAAH